MPARVGRIRQQLCAACPAPCAAMTGEANPPPFADPAHRCELGRFGAYDRATIAEPISPLPPSRPQRTPHWGPAQWQALHTTARDGLLTPAWLVAFNSGIPNLPCGCRNHWRSVLAALPPPHSAPAAEQFAWSWQAHNAVNGKLGKPLLSLEAAGRLHGLHPLPEAVRHANVTDLPPNSLDTDGGIGSVRV